MTGPGQTLTADLSTLGINTLKVLLDALTGQRNFLFANVRTVVPFTVGAYKYLIGPFADNDSPPGQFGQGQYNEGEYPGTFTEYGPGIATDRPVEIQTWAVLLGSIGGNPPLELPHRRTISVDEYNLCVTLKQLGSTFPTALYYNPTSPNGTLNFWPVPSQGGNAMVLYYAQLIDQIADLEDKIFLPPGYNEALEYMLAMRLAPKFGRTPSEEVKKFAREAKAFLKARNSYVPELAIPFSRRGGYYSWIDDRIV